MSDLQIYDAHAERSAKAYEAFTRIYMLEHPQPKPIPWWRGLPWMMIPFGIISIAGIALSSLRTAPVFREIALKIVGLDLATAEAILALVVVDLFMVISRYQHIILTGSGQEETVKKWILRGFWVAFSIAIGANLYASVGNLPILSPFKSFLDLVIGIIVGLSAPVLSFISGDILGILWLQSDSYRKDLEFAVSKAMEDWTDAKERSWSSQRNRYGVKIDVSPVPLSERRLSDQTDSRQTLPASSGFNRTPDGQRRVMEYLNQYPEDVTLSSRDLASKIESVTGIKIGHDTANKGRNAWRDKS